MPWLIFSRTLLFITTIAPNLLRFRHAGYEKRIRGVARVSTYHAQRRPSPALARASCLLRSACFGRKRAPAIRLAQVLRGRCAARRMRCDRRGRYRADGNVAEAEQVILLHLVAQDVLHQRLRIWIRWPLRVHVLDAPELVVAGADV